MSEEHTVTFNLEVDTSRVLRDIQLVNTAFNRVVSVLRKMGLPENVMEAISFVQRLIMLVNQLRLAMIALQAATGPYGWAMALLGLAGTQFSAADVALEVHSH